MVRRTPAALLVLALLAATAPAVGAQTEPTVKLMVLGETHGTRSVTRDLVGIAAAKGATGCVCPGDFIYGDWSTTPGAWRDMMRPLMGTMLPAQGNHDWPWSDWSSMFPQGARYYARDVNGAQLISLNTEHSLAPGSTQRAWLEARLAERDHDALKVVFMHRPWWLPDGARHPASEFAQKNGASAAEMSALMERTGVDLVISAHEKNHQHSLVNGVHYLVAGGGGPEFYAMGYALPGAVKRLQTQVVTTMDVTPTRLTLKSYTRDWAKVDEWTITAGAVPPTSVTFRPEGGNEWWVQTRIDGAPVTRVEAKDTGGAWTPLAHRSWGAWAASFHVEPGHHVTYRATLADGRVVTSCAYAHPTGGCAGTAPPANPVTFRHARGNEWWIEVEADAATVETRVNDGAWTPLGKTPWGSWAKSLHAPTGSTVHFRATTTAGTATTSGAYAWPP